MCSSQGSVKTILAMSMPIMPYAMPIGMARAYAISDQHDIDSLPIDQLKKYTSTRTKWA